jgi:branched-chain amino acid transport system substrate-binding protein
LKLAGKAGAVAGLGLGLGGLLSACQENEDTPNTIATIGSDPTTTDAPRPTTTVRAGPETGRYLRIGVVSAATGPLALFGKADEWWIDFAKAALPKGVLCGDGILRKVKFMVQDSRSDPSTAAAGAATLVTEGKADILLCSGPAEMVNPVATQAEVSSCPCLSSFVHWRPYIFGRGGTLDTPFRWTYAYAIGLEDVVGNYLAMWGQVETNKKVGFVFTDGPEAAIWTDEAAGLPATAAAAGYEPVLPGLYAAGGVDYSPLISGFIKDGCELCCGAMSATDFVAFWKQSLEMGYRPKVLTMSQALLFPQALEAIGIGARGVTAESLWQPDWPFADSITGRSAERLAQDYMTRTGEQWTAPIAQYACFEWAVDAFSRSRDIDSKDVVVEAIAATKLDTCMGTIDFLSPVDAVDLSKSKRPVKNVCKAPVGGAQWIEGDAFAFEPRTVSNVNSPALEIAAPVEALAYSG